MGPLLICNVFVEHEFLKLKLVEFAAQVHNFME
jgi:hypothetical protein